MPYAGEKSPLRRAGETVVNTDSVTDRDASNSRATDLPGERSLFSLLPFKHAGEAETATLLPNSLVALHGTGCFPVRLWTASMAQVRVLVCNERLCCFTPLRTGGYTKVVIIIK